MALVVLLWKVAAASGDMKKALGVCRLHITKLSLYVGRDGQGNMAYIDDTCHDLNYLEAKTPAFTSTMIRIIAKQETLARTSTLRNVAEN
ncbi:hypothetical protein EJB05_15444, partial [Eragrostis curvula]